MTLVQHEPVWHRLVRIFAPDLPEATLQDPQALRAIGNEVSQELGRSLVGVFWYAMLGGMGALAFWWTMGL